MTDGRPRRAVTLTLDMQADSRTDIIRGLLNVIYRLEREDMSTGATDGPTVGYRYSYHEADRTGSDA